MNWSRVLGRIVRNAREDRNLTQEDVAGQVQRSKQAVSSWEKGKSEPDVETKDKLAELLNIPRAALDGNASSVLPSEVTGTTLEKTDTRWATAEKDLRAPVVGNLIAPVAGSWGAVMIDLLRKPQPVVRIRVRDRSLEPLCRPDWCLVIDKRCPASDGTLALAQVSRGEQHPTWMVGFLLEHTESKRGWYLNDVSGKRSPVAIADPALAYSVVAIQTREVPVYQETPEHLAPTADAAEGTGYETPQERAEAEDARAEDLTQESADRGD